jgi:flavodoxin
MKKCLIIYHSYHHGNTEKIASAMAEASAAKLCKAEEVKGKNLDDFEIIGFGAGIAMGKYYDQLLKAVDGLSLSGRTVFVFSTSGEGKASYNTPLMEQLKKMGANVVGDFACKGFDTVGPLKLVGGISKGHPDEADIDAAKKFILEIVK